MTAQHAIVGTSSERSRRVHLIRSLVAVVLLPVIVLAGLAAVGSTPVWSALAPAASSTPTPSATAVPLESRVQPADPRRVTENVEPAGSPRPASPIRVEPAPPSAARLATGPVVRIVDTRNTDPTDRIDTIDLPAPGPAVTALVVSVSLIGSERAGTVTVEGSAGVVEALSVAGPGAMTTNGLVVIPGSGPARLHNPAGGDVIVDLVGRFEATGPASAGRVLAVEPVRVAELVTATDGREIEFALGPSGVAGQGDPSAAVVVISADIGSDGGRIAFGPSGGEPNQMSMWGPPTGTDRQRTVVALVTPGENGRVALRYDGGSVLAVDLIAQVTGDDAATSSAGLFLPVTTIDAIDQPVPAGTTAVASAVPATASVLVGLRAEGGATGDGLPAVELATDLTAASRQTTGTILPVQVGPDGGMAIAVTSAADLRARIQPLGYLLAGTP